MKTLVLFFALTMLVLGACEEIIIEKVVDTVYVDKPRTSLVQTIHVDTVYKELILVDTVEVTVVVRDTIVNNIIQHDTVFQVQTDSIFIERIVEKVVNHYDTIVVQQIVNHTDTIYVDKIVTIHDTVEVIHYDQTVSYLSIEYVMIYMRNVTSIPEAIQPHVNEFFGLTNTYNKNAPGGPILIYYVPGDDLPGEQWVSHSYWIGGAFTPYGQMVIEISEQLPPEQHRNSILRELSRLQLSKKYVTDINKIMCPLFDPSHIVTKLQIDELFN